MILIQILKLFNLQIKTETITMDVSQLFNIVLSVASITLAIVAIWFAWISYKHSTEMQVKAQGILEQVTQKVEVLVKLTSSQIEKAWDYFTHIDIQSEKPEEITFNVEELKNQIISETKKETERLIQESGIEKNKIEMVTSKVEKIVDESAEKTEGIFNKQKIIERYSEIELELKKWYERKLKWMFPPNIFMVHMLQNEEIKSVLPKNMLEEIKKFTDIRNRIAHSKPVNKEEIEQGLKISESILSFLKII